MSAPLRLEVFQPFHVVSHPGTRATAKLVAQRFVWTGVQKNCRTWPRSCCSRQCSKVYRRTVTPLGDFTPPAGRFLHVHTDLLGPLPTSVDCFTRSPEVAPSPDITVNTVARTLLTGWRSGFGCPPSKGVVLNMTLPIPGQAVWLSALADDRSPHSN
jgi:hypothetical protein